MSRKVIFKTYNQDQLSLLAPNYDELITDNHPVRIVNTIIDHIDISALEASYKEEARQVSIRACCSRSLSMPICATCILHVK